MIVFSEDWENAQDIVDALPPELKGELQDHLSGKCFTLGGYIICLARIQRALPGSPAAKIARQAIVRCAFHSDSDVSEDIKAAVLAAGDTIHESRRSQMDSNKAEEILLNRDDMQSLLCAVMVVIQSIQEAAQLNFPLFNELAEFVRGVAKQADETLDDLRIELFKYISKESMTFKLLLAFRSQGERAWWCTEALLAEHEDLVSAAGREIQKKLK